ncbi:MAG TPA: hypothetical protein VFY73_27865 [Ideonella sp.]|uniref:hypothetical protein n=1 Tax=Ideonella sp. TaxID=1929293 RepID=UPI002E3019D9|nr:hypothetical protein [Ideonella sp.]HEX5687850.1 hypothetical protein [Ideonella sp.]
MFLKDSRYLPAHRFEPLPDGSMPFKGVRPRWIGPATGVLEHGLQPGERLDWLATHYFNDSRLWWRIVDANSDLLCALELEAPGLRPPPGAGGTEDPSPTADDFGVVALIPRARE